MKRTFISAGLILTILSLFSVAALAFPSTMSYQGILKDKNNSALTGTYAMVFSIYNAVGPAVWHETQSVTASGGLFNVTLGSVTALTPAVFDGNAKFIGIAVGTDSEMTPRTALMPVLYAFRASVADSLSTGAVTSAATATTAGYSILTGTATTAGYAILSGSSTVAATASNALAVNGIPASTEALNGKLFPISTGGQFPIAVIPTSEMTASNSEKVGGRSITVGSGTIAEGETSISIASSAVATTSVILVTGGPQDLNPGSIYVSARSTGSFTIKIANSAPSGGYVFSYLIIN